MSDHIFSKVLIIGAGPAGAFLAYLLAHKGIEVLLVDKAFFPREKVCGDALISDSLNALDRAGLYDLVARRAYSVNKLQLIAPDRSAVNLHYDSFTLKRYHFDHLLLEQAIQAGANVLQGTKITRFIEEDGSVVGAQAKTPHGKEIILRSDLTVLATGAATGLIKKANLLESPLPSAFAVRVYHHGRLNGLSGQLTVFYERALLPGYAWVFPLGPDLYNIGCSVFLGHVTGEQIPNLRSAFNGFLAQLAESHPSLDLDRLNTSLKGAPIRTGLTGAQLCGDRIMAVGEAIGVTYPLTGEGIGKSLESAEVAAEVISEADNDFSSQSLLRYKLLMDSRFGGKYRSYSSAQRWVKYPFVLNFITDRVRKSPVLRRRVEGILAEEQDPTEIFSLWGLLKAFVGR
ncbi:MAG: hypothetical protein A3F84_03555 [Candidatus Handelsmanbacteria bacterium RIFCSPLOWO2_12_FULL_64_10]|uniref:FAD-binding domain-containing protein n=1 Tax=Handelsmanbacteria sp. (strain RIFCSPLOWO2_12_FULL_64_10) TaxID=1817868 RepID=A0A1F6CCT8_HANXR|nr:MAG: hypothetical protein A3F84_03555 [Candidatus Handelsmanbacteria bacterium RIFCSPLOWO2_12_FULL_64_10]